MSNMNGKVYRFGIGFCEASGPCLVRHAGNDADLDVLATNYAYKLSAGHCIVILMRCSSDQYSNETKRGARVS
ncbi:MAG: adenosine-specific kinase [Candidatus Nitrosopolaris sp.]|jgi:adenosine/AMP kinase